MKNLIPIFSLFLSVVAYGCRQPGWKYTFTNGCNDLTQAGSTLVFENNQAAAFSQIHLI